MLPQEANGKELFRLTSTRRLLDQPQSVANRRALVVGDVNYSAKSVYVEGQNDEVAYRKMGNLHFGNLKMSKEEIDKILLYRNYPQDHLLSGDGATESEFRRLCPQYPIIHVSSHGKLNTKGIPFGTDLKPCQNDSSLSESTIAFAGINTSLADEAFDPRKQQDGILSSKEMAALDMKGVELVVLSCCETGLGQVTADGVYGIQRGLKNAGAGAIVLTLWEVSDDENTNLFMAGFHRRMKEGKPIGQAFRETRQEDFLSKDDYSVNRPCYRDVFILIDAIE
jgi:CHAT domain-containing protein